MDDITRKILSDAKDGKTALELITRNGAHIIGRVKAFGQSSILMDVAGEWQLVIDNAVSTIKLAK